MRVVVGGLRGHDHQGSVARCLEIAGQQVTVWCKGLPQATSDRSGKADLRGAYGVLGQEMIAWLTGTRPPAPIP